MVGLVAEEITTGLQGGKWRADMGAGSMHEGAMVAEDLQVQKGMKMPGVLHGSPRQR